MARDFAREIAAAAKANDNESLLALAIELAGENQELRAIAARDADRRQRQANRKQRSRSRDVTGRSVTERDVSESHSPERDTVGQAVTSSPLPIPSPSLPEPHLTTPLTPLPSAPPPARERAEASDPQVHELETTLAARLASDADRNALTTLITRLPKHFDGLTWLSEMKASLDGMAGHMPLTPEQLGKAIRDYVGNGAMTNPGLEHFRVYVRRAAKSRSTEPAHAPTDDFDTAVSKTVRHSDLEAEAAEVLVAIRALIVEKNMPGHGSRRWIVKADVEKLGERAFRAYQAVGGSERVLETKGEKVGYLIRDFTKAYVHASVTPALAGGAA